MTITEVSCSDPFQHYPHTTGTRTFCSGGLDEASFDLAFTYDEDKFHEMPICRGCCALVSFEGRAQHLAVCKPWG